MSKKKRKKTNTFLQSKNKKNMMSVKQKSKKGKVLYKVRYPWDVSKRKVYSPSYERLESFLKEVGNKSPFELCIPISSGYTGVLLLKPPPLSSNRPNVFSGVLLVTKKSPNV